MTNAIKDSNRTPVALGVSYSDGTTLVPIKLDSTQNNGIILDTTHSIGFTPTQIALRDDNREPILMAVSSSSATTLVPVLVDPSTGGILVDVA